MVDVWGKPFEELVHIVTSDDMWEKSISVSWNFRPGGACVKANHWYKTHEKSCALQEIYDFLQKCKSISMYETDMPELCSMMHDIARTFQHTYIKWIKNAPAWPMQNVIGIQEKYFDIKLPNLKEVNVMVPSDELIQYVCETPSVELFETSYALLRDYNAWANDDAPKQKMMEYVNAICTSEGAYLTLYIHWWKDVHAILRAARKGMRVQAVIMQSEMWSTYYYVNSNVLALDLPSDLLRLIYEYMPTHCEYDYDELKAA